MNFFCCLNDKSVSCETPKIGDTRKTYGIMTSKGWKPGHVNWINQDNFLILEDDIRRFYGIMDGHGPNGHHASEICRDQLREKLTSITKSHDNIPISDENEACEIQFQKIFQEIQMEFLKSMMEFNCSGTTCTIVFIGRNNIQIANVGDSSATLTRRDSDGRNIEIIPLTCKHSPDKPEEVERIQNYGGSVFSRTISPADAKALNKTQCKEPILGPLRVWYPSGNNNNSMMGLAMTRSLGDLNAHDVGVSSEPHVLIQPLTENDEFIIMASDGLWDVLSQEEASNIVLEYIQSLTPRKSKHEWDPHEATHILVVRARRKWARSFNFIDDITCCVIKLKNI